MSPLIIDGEDHNFRSQYLTQRQVLADCICPWLRKSLKKFQGSGVVTTEGDGKRRWRPLAIDLSDLPPVVDDDDVIITSLTSLGFLNFISSLVSAKVGPLILTFTMWPELYM